MKSGEAKQMSRAGQKARSELHMKLRTTKDEIERKWEVVEQKDVHVASLIV